MSDTRVADVLDAVYDLFAADATLAALVAGETLRMFDGPPTTDFAAQTMLVVGGTVDADAVDEPDTTVSWDWGSLGVSGQYAAVDEWIDVPCGIASKDGGRDMRTVRRRAIDVYAAAAAAVRASTLAIDVVMWCISSVSSIRQLQTQSGAECLVAFVVRVRTRI